MAKASGTVKKSSGVTTSVTPNSKPSAPAKVKVLALQDFRSLNNFNEAYKKGDDLSHLPEARLDELRAAGMIK